MIVGAKSFDAVHEGEPAILGQIDRVDRELPDEAVEQADRHPDLPRLAGKDQQRPRGPGMAAHDRPVQPGEGVRPVRGQPADDMAASGDQASRMAAVLGQPCQSLQHLLRLDETPGADQPIAGGQALRCRTARVAGDGREVSAAWPSGRD